MPETTVPAGIVDFRRTPAGRHVVLLAAGDRELPIWIGASDAEALAPLADELRAQMAARAEELAEVRRERAEHDPPA